MNELSPRPQGPGLIRSFPLLALLLIAYNVATFMLGYDFHAQGAKPLFELKLMSGSIWTVTWSEILVMAGLGLLFIELIKSTRATVLSTAEHALSMLVFIIFLIEFLVVAPAGTNTFFNLGIMALIDVMAGYAISVAVARKDLNITG